MKKWLLLFVVLLLAVLTPQIVLADETAQDGVSMADFEGFVDGCFNLFTKFQDRINPYLTGTATDMARFNRLADDIRWEAGVNCGAILYLKVPDELASQESNLFYASYNYLMGVELILLGVEKKDTKLYIMAQEVLLKASKYAQEMVDAGY